MRRRGISLLALAAVLIVSAACGSQPQQAAAPTKGAGAPSAGSQATGPKFPTRPIHIIVPTKAGGTYDRHARQFAPVLQKELGVPVIVEDRPGALGVQAADYVFHATPDGYTLLEAYPQIVIQQLLGNAQYNLEKFTAIYQWVDDGWALIVKSNAPWKTFSAFVKASKAKPLPVGGVGKQSALDYWLMGKYTGLHYKYIPYKSGADMLPALLGGEVDSIPYGALTGAKPLIEAGKVRALLQSYPAGVKLPAPLSGVPSVAAINPKARANRAVWLLAPPHTPAAVVDVLAKANAAAFKDPKLQAMLGPGAAPLGPAQTAQHIQQVMTQMAPVIKQAFH